ncbi:MAG: SAM-dependent methyltransferase [Trebonia sp.]
MSAHETPVSGWDNSVPDWSRKLPPFDASTAHPARVYDYLLGGKDNFAADRAAAEAIIEVSPVVFACVRANRAFLRRAVRYLAGQAGIRQFLDIGTGLPTAQNTHQVAQQVAPECRVVYVDNDPIVLAHARALLTSDPAGACDYIDADLRDTDKVLSRAAGTLDFGRPVAVMVLCTMQYVPDAEDPHAIISRLMDAVPSGSYLAMSDTTRDIDTETMTTGAQRYNAKLGSAVFTPRSGAEYTRFFDRLSLVEPGLVPMPRWRPDPGSGPGDVIPMYAAIGRKP